jgi:amino acid transporter
MSDEARPSAAAGAPGPALVRVLGLWDIVFLTIVAVTGLRWIARGARVGAPSVLLWILAWMAFFVPLAVAVAVLARRHPEQGGIYAWVSRALGPFNAVLCGWCLWVNNLFYFPSLLLFAAANAAVVLAAFVPNLADNRLFSAVFVLGFLWLIVAVNIRGFAAGRSLQTLGLVGTWIPVGLVIVGAAVALATFGSATSFAPRALVPSGDVLDTISLWSAFCFAFSGF